MGDTESAVGYCKYCYEDTLQEYFVEQNTLPDGRTLTTRQLICRECDHALAPYEEVSKADSGWQN